MIFNQFFLICYTHAKHALPIETGSWSAAVTHVHTRIGMY